MILRLCKIFIVAALALQASLVAFGNLTDYDPNATFVRQMLSMDSIFPDATIRYRAITATWLQYVAYDAIIAFEALTALLCWLGAWRMWRRRHAPAVLFERAKGLAAAGLATGLLVWLVGFMGVGGEWFGMWMSSQWNGLEAAFRLTVLLMLALVFLAVRDAELA